MPETSLANTLMVETSEGGQKLLQFLLRRLALPQPLLHRWIRTGQIRLNGGRAKPFAHVLAHDMVRLPPFALGMVVTKGADAPMPTQGSPAQPTDMPPLPPIIYSDEHLLVFNKPSGLPIHKGTGHSDSLATRLAQHFAHLPFCPTPAHRLDKDTSGLLVTARSYAALRALQDCLENGHLSKEYLTWVQGSWPPQEPQLLRHWLGKRYSGNEEKVQVLPPHEGKEALSVAHCLRRTQQCSLMHILLLTGRTHQIRVQMAAGGCPLLGDVKYGGPSGPLRLHALRLTLPPTPALTALGLHDLQWTALPPWQQWQAVQQAPPVLTKPDLQSILIN